MSGMEVFGMVAFAMAIVALGRVERLERLLRENGIGPAKNTAPGGQLQKYIGQTLSLTFYDASMETACKTCRVLDVDETWALLLADEGGKKERELLIRLDNVKQIKVK